MRYQVFSTYYQLSIEGKVKPLRCLVADHPILMPVPGEDDDWADFICLACDYKITPGLNLAQMMVKAIKEVYKDDESED